MLSAIVLLSDGLFVLLDGLLVGPSGRYLEGCKVARERECRGQDPREEGRYVIALRDCL